MITRLISWVSNHPKGLTWHSWILLVFTILLATVAGLFSINGYINHPQHARFEDFANIYQFIQGHDHKKWYYAFFVLDAIWAPILLSWGLHVLITLKLNREIDSDKQDTKQRAEDYPRSKTPDFVPGIYLLLIVVAYLLDFVEGVHYVCGWGTNLSDIVTGKTVAYGLAILVLLYGCWKYWNLMPNLKRSQQRSIRIFLSSSYLSILTVIIVAGILTFIPQGITVVVHDLASGQNLFFMVILISFLALVVSHYPAYFEARREEMKPKLDWFMIEDWPLLKWSARNLGLGFVYYRVNDDFKGQTLFDPRARMYRHHLGSLVILALMYAVLFTANEVYNFPLPPSLVALLLIGAIVYYNALSKWEKKTEKVRGFLFVSSLITAILLITTSLISFLDGWSKVLVYFTLITLTGVLITYITYRILRKKAFGVGNKGLVFFMGVFGWGTMIAIVLLNLFLDFTHQWIGPVTLLLLYLINLYGLVSISSKHVQFFYDNPLRRNNQLRFIIPLIPILLLIWIQAKRPIFNDLHYLNEVPELKSEPMAYSKFINTWKEQAQRDTSGQEVYLMGTSYGGGLMADLWAMLVLHELQKETQGKLLNRTLNLSSNSGGTIGFGNYANLWLYHGSGMPDHSYDTISGSIQRIGNFNHLSIDFVSLLGRDLVRQLLPCEWEGRDRSYEAMGRYAQMTGDLEAISNRTQSFRSRYNQIYQASGYFPSMVFATTSADGSLGNCFSLKMDDQRWDRIFRGTSNILDIKGSREDSSLTYYGALSASNRFPLFSPVASIRGEGHYLDGGYYDNSGLMNSLELLEDFLNAGAIPNEEQVRYYMINNSRSKYIRYLFKDWIHREVDEKGVGQLSAILNTATKIDKVSRHLEARADDYKGVRVFLPLRLTYEDVVKEFGGEPKCPLQVIQCIDRNNRKIDEALQKAKNGKLYDFEKWGVVEPPTARLLSRQGVAYEQAMVLYHDDVRRQIAKINSWFGGKPSNQQMPDEYRCDYSSACE
ncbi:hypothetical protein KFE98_18525 [bacterium SCSIO 12741]|nr:hypothetical protein KFE98_18525 [bacterium SCSIO 12741]